MIMWHSYLIKESLVVGYVAYVLQWHTLKDMYLH